MKRLSLRHRFALDAILLACCDGRTGDPLSLVAAFFDALHFEVDTVEFLCGLAKSILEQDAQGYADSLSLPGAGNCEGDFASPYTSRLPGSYTILNAARLEAHFTELTDISEQKQLLEALEIPGSVRTLLIENAVFKEAYSFCEWDRLVFRNCRFALGENTITFEMGEVTFQGCRFSDSKRRIFVFNKRVKTAQFMECQFENCYYWYESESRNTLLCDGLLFTRNPDLYLTISDSCFTDCGAVNRKNSAYSGFFTNVSSVALFRNRFIQCQHYHATSNITRGGFTMFPSVKVNEDNELINSAKLC